MERYASDDSQRFLAKIQKVRIFLIRNEDDMAASVFNSLDTARVVADPELLNDYIQCEAVLCSDMLSSDISEEEKMFTGKGSGRPARALWLLTPPLSTREG